MKRLLLLVCAVMGLASPAWGGGLMIGSGISVVGGCTSCTTSTDVNYASGTSYSDNAHLSTTFAWSFTASTEKCVTGITVWGSDLTDIGNGATCSIYTDASGSPGTLVGAEFSSTLATFNYNNQIPEYKELLFATTQTLSSGNYWVVCASEGNIAWGRAASLNSGVVKYWTGSAWEATDWKVMLGVLWCE